MIHTRLQAGFNSVAAEAVDCCCNHQLSQLQHHSVALAAVGLDPAHTSVQMQPKLSARFIVRDVQC